MLKKYFRLHYHRANINRLLGNVWVLFMGNISSKFSTIIDDFEIPTFLIDGQAQI